MKVKYKLESKKQSTKSEVKTFHQYLKLLDYLKKKLNPNKSKIESMNL
jgi:hypothetical protein